MNIAIVHDDFMQWGGAERVVAAMLEVWPDADLYTAVYDESIISRQLGSGQLDSTQIKASFLQHWIGRKLYRPLFFLHPLAFESFDFSDYDVVISSTTRFAKSIKTKPGTLHICYCNTPPRFLWPIDKANQQSWIMEPLLSLLRMHDFTAAQQVDHFIGNSQEVARRIEKFYRRKATVIYPFVDLERFALPTNNQQLTINNYFLIVSRLSPQKRVDLAVEAFKELPKENLVIIGDGPQRGVLEKTAPENVKFLGRVSDEEVVAYLQNCRAFIYPQKEDFGITALEAQAVGKPIIAYKDGGALETVIKGETGIFFDKQTPPSLAGAVRKFLNPKGSKLEPERIRENAERFSKERFKTELKEFVESLVK